MTEPIRELRPEPSADPRITSEAVLYEIRRVIVGQDAMLERVLVALRAGGRMPVLEGRALSALGRAQAAAGHQSPGLGRG